MGSKAQSEETWIGHRTNKHLRIQNGRSHIPHFRRFDFQHYGTQDMQEEATSKGKESVSTIHPAMAHNNAIDASL